MRKKLLVVAIIVICLSMAAYGTVAYFTADDIATNVVTAGNVDVTLKETAIPAEGGEPVPFEDVIGVMPGTEVSKIVEVENTGDNEAYIRVRVEKEIALAEGVTGEVDTSLISLNVDTQNWVEKDGYFYYTKPLSAGETTAPLFTTVTFEAGMENLYQNSKATIRVFAQAVQSDNNGADVMAATGWPAE